VKGVDASYANHVRSLYHGPPDRDGFDWERLFGAGEAIQSLTLHPGWSVLMDLLSAEREALRSRLEGGRPLPVDEVQHLLGQLRGIAAAEQAATALLAISHQELEEQQRKHESTGESVAA
jgi:hypothetical protein